VAQNVKIPMQLFSQIIDLLEHLVSAGHDPAIAYDYDNVYFALLKKRQSLELREAYAKIIYADTEDARTEARIRYLQEKRFNDDNF